MYRWTRARGCLPACAWKYLAHLVSIQFSWVSQWMNEWMKDGRVTRLDMIICRRNRTIATFKRASLLNVWILFIVGRWKNNSFTPAHSDILAERLAHSKLKLKFQTKKRSRFRSTSNNDWAVYVSLFFYISFLFTDQNEERFRQCNSYIVQHSE